MILTVKQGLWCLRKQNMQSGSGLRDTGPANYVGARPLPPLTTVPDKRPTFENANKNLQKDAPIFITPSSLCPTFLDFSVKPFGIL